MRNELIDFFRFYFNTKDEYKLIIFYTEHSGYHPIYEKLIRILINDHNFKLSIITSDKNDSILRKKEKNIKTFYINNLLGLFMSFVNCKVFIMTMPDLNNFHIKRSINDVHYIYLFHALVSTHMMYLEGAFNHYDTIVCNGKYQIDEIKKNEKLYGLKKKNILSTGYSRLDRITRSYEEYLINKTPKNKKDTILIAPSWGKDNVIESIGDKLIDKLLINNYNVILRPHPEMTIRQPAIIKELNDKYSSYVEFKLDTNNADDTSMIYSDLLICDCSGIALEYAFGTKRPVLFFNVPLKIKNENYKILGIEPFELWTRELIGEVIEPNDLDKAIVNIKEMINNKKKYVENINSLIEDNLFSNTSIGEVEANFIEDYVNNDSHKAIG